MPTGSLVLGLAAMGGIVPESSLLAVDHTPSPPPDDQGRGILGCMQGLHFWLAPLLLCLCLKTNTLSLSSACSEGLLNEASSAACQGPFTGSADETATGLPSDETAQAGCDGTHGAVAVVQEGQGILGSNSGGTDGKEVWQGDAH